jgi:hypothetical protein
MKAPKSAPRPVANDGQHVGRIVGLVDLGTHTETFEGKEKTARKVRLEIELPTEQAVFKDGEDPRPFIVHREFTFSMGQKASLRKTVEAIRGAFNSQAEANDFDLRSLLGMPCMATVETRVSETSGNKYSKLTAIAKFQTRIAGVEITCPAQVNQSRYYSIEEHGCGPVFQALPEFIQEEIKGSPEFIDAANHS